MTVKEFLTRYDNNEKFTEDELHDLYCGDIEAEDGDEIEEMDTAYDEQRRWSRYETVYMRFNDRYFDFTADIGLTEYQENCYDIQPVEVTPIQKVVVVTTWEEV